MNTSYYRGSLLPAVQSLTFDFDPVRGWVYRSTNKSLSKENMIALQNEFAALGITCSLTTALGVSTLEAVDATQQFTLDDWQMDGEPQRFDLLTNPKILAMDLDNHDTRILRTNFSDPTLEWDDVYSQMNDLDNGTLLEEFYNLYLRGTTEFENDADGTGYVLKHCTNVSNRWTENIADFNVGKIYSTAELLTEVTDSSLWINPLDDRRVYKISNIPVPSPQVGYYWGWKKSRSNEATAANNRVNIQTHYTLALWNVSVLYTAFP